jgi:5'-nucleotidase / UDP-sugar diphosphatase
MKHFLIALSFLILTASANATTYSIVVMHSNDVHGGIDSSEAVFMNPEYPPELGGGASAARLIQWTRKYCADNGKGFLLMDTGDIFQGTLVGTKTKGEAVVRVMNELGYDLWVPGNHEFDLGRQVPEKLMKEAEFPVITANVLDSTGGGLADFARPYIIKKIGPFKVGIIGITTTGTEHMAFKENIRGLTFAPEVSTLTAYRDTLRQLGADIIIAACHLGLPYDRWQAWADLEKWEKQGWKSDYARNAFELARRVPGISVMFCGDIHVGYQEPWVDPVTHTPCFQGYGRGTNLLMVELQFDVETKSLIGWKPFQDQGTLVTLLSERFPRDRRVAESIDTSVARVEKGFNEKVGESIIPITRSGEGESLMGNLVCDAMLWKMKGDLAITNKGGVRTDLPQGTITPRDIFDVLPFDNTLGSVTVTGQFIRDLLEEKVAFGGSGLYVSGIRVKVDRNKPRGERIVSLEVAGKPCDANGQYRLITTDYLLEGNSGMEKLSALRSQAAIESGIYMRESLTEYVKEFSPLEPKLDGRWQYVDTN